MNRQRGDVLSVIQFCALFAIATLYACVAPTSTPADEPAFAVVEFLYKGEPMDVRVAPYTSIAKCETDIHEKAKHAHSFPDVEVRYLCVPTGTFKHLDALGGPAPVEPAPTNQITRL